MNPINGYYTQRHTRTDIVEYVRMRIIQETTNCVPYKIHGRISFVNNLKDHTIFIYMYNAMKG